MPHDQKSKDKNSLMVLLIKDTMQCIDILDNKKVMRRNLYLRYNKPNTININLFKKNIKKRMSPSDIKDLKSFLRTMNMVYVDNIGKIDKKNLVFDTSWYNELFFERCQGKNVDIIAKMYFSMLRDYLDKFITVDYSTRYIVIDTAHWGVSKANISTQLASVLKVLNPVSLMYYLMRKKVDDLKILHGYKFLIEDSNFGWFVFDVDSLNDESYLKYAAVLQKLKSETEIIDPVSAAHAEDIVNETEPDDSDDTSDEEDSEVYAKGGIDDTSEDDKLLMAYQEIEDEDQAARRSIKSTKRDAELREAQKKIKIRNVTMGELDYDTMNSKESFIEEVDLSSKIISPHKNMKRSKFDNFNESYTKKQMTKDIVSIFDCMKDRSNPVYVRKIDVKDSSTPSDLKETWNFQLEGADRVRHSVTIDVPKIYDKNYLYLGGNRKQCVNQLFSVPVIKIEPTVVQICTNYNKVFMYRYGDILSPKVTVFKKIILNNPKLFTVKRGNGMALSDGARTSIEYDSLAKDFVDIHINGTGVHLRFDQKFFKKLAADGQINPIDESGKYIYFFYDSKATTKATRAVAVNTDSSAGEESDEANGIINLFAAVYQKHKGTDFWALAGDKDKPGKRFMYTRCKIMEKFIPTGLLLAYWEGLSTVLRKAHIKYEFTDKRTQIGYDKGRIEFADGFLVFEREPAEHSLLMNGFSLVDTKNYNFSDFDSKDVYLNIFDSLYNSRILGVSLDAYYDNLIDPKTYAYLKTHNYPTDIVSLMIFANALLADNNYVSELDMSNYRLRNLEIIYAYMYKIIARAYGEYKRTSMNAHPTKISVPKNELIKTLLTSNIVEDYSIINPITEKEKLHGATHKGPSGMNLERSYTEEKRCFDPSMTGLIGMSTSPDANCGVQRELTMEPKVLDTYGTIDVQKPIKEMKDVNLFTYAESLTTNAVVRDDTIRTSMSVKQSNVLLAYKSNLIFVIALIAGNSRKRQSATKPLWRNVQRLSK
jgi:UDP-2,3-diacylglucosamine pyrophosphatase LpxH